jgi:hypothetical protein
MKVRLNLTIERELKDTAIVLAKRYRRSVSQLFEDLVVTSKHTLKFPCQQVTESDRMSVEIAKNGHDSPGMYLVVSNLCIILLA